LLLPKPVHSAAVRPFRFLGVLVAETTLDICEGLDGRSRCLFPDAEASGDIVNYRESRYNGSLLRDARSSADNWI